MPTLNQLLPYKAKKSTDALFPVKLTWEERRMMFNCPIYNYSVSVYSCWQCPHAETHSQAVTDLTKRSCHCLWPHKASKPARKLTALVALKVTGVADAESTIETRRAAKAEKLKKARMSRPQRDGQAVKLDYVKTLMQQKLSKEQIKIKMIEKYSTMSDGYIAALTYKAAKELGIVFESSKSKKQGGGLQEKIEATKALLSKSTDKAKVVSKLAQMYPTISEAYASTLFYQAAKAAGISLPKKKRGKTTRKC